MLELNRVYCMDALAGLKLLDDNSIDCCVTSPPYWGLRSYGTEPKVWDGDANCQHEWSNFIRQGMSGGTSSEKVHIHGTENFQKFDAQEQSFCIKCGAWKGELGLEPTFELYLQHLMQIFMEVQRVLKKTGTCWVNIADSYSGTGNKGSWRDPKYPNGRNGQANRMTSVKSKSQCGIPERFVIAMLDSGWIKRNTIIWHKCLAAITPIYGKSMGIPLRTTIKDFARLPLDTLYIAGNNEWKKVIRISKQPRGELLRIHLRNGLKVTVTPDHKFPTANGLVFAKDLKKGDMLLHGVLPDNKGTLLGTPDVGYVIGLYIAEGSKTKDTVQFSLNSKEDAYYFKVKEFADKFAASALQYKYDNKMHVHLTGTVATSIIDKYVSGYGSKNKHLSRDAFIENNIFLEALLQGYLDGDGHLDVPNNRYRIGFALNRELENDLRCICARLGYHMRSKRGHATCGNNGKVFPIIRGEIRKSTSGHFNQKDDYEVLKVFKTHGISYEVEVDGDHIFALCDGTLTHNSNAMPASVKDRFTIDFEPVYAFTKQSDEEYEPVYFFTKNNKYYFRQQLEPSVKVHAVKSYHHLDNPKYASIPAEHYKDQFDGRTWGKDGLRNKRCVWDINTVPYKEAHYATFPIELVRQCLGAGCPVGGVVVDPFMGSGTTASAAIEKDMQFIGFDLLPRNIELSSKRIRTTCEKLLADLA